MSLSQEQMERLLEDIGIDVEDVWRKAGEVTTQIMRDRMLYGFNAVKDGKRVNPKDLTRLHNLS